MAAIRIDVEDLIMALDDHSGLVEWYLDRETGEVLRRSDELLGEEDEELGARIETNPGCYAPIEPLPSREAWQAMADFAAGVSDERARRSLERAVHGERPFRRFKEVLFDYPDERERWFRFKDDAYRRYAAAWLVDNDIEALLVPAAGQARSVPK